MVGGPLLFLGEKKRAADSFKDISKALIIALKLFEIQKGDEIITVTNTFYATVGAIVSCGAKPVFVDINHDDYLIDVNKIEAAINKKTKAIIVPHIYGLPVDMDPLIKLTKKYNVKIVEDAAEVIGLKYKNKPCGSFGEVSRGP